LDDMGVSKLSAKVFLKVNYSFNALDLHVILADLIKHKSKHSITGLAAERQINEMIVVA